MTSDTPRCDALIENSYKVDKEMWEEIARQLERELAVAATALSLHANGDARPSDSLCTLWKIADMRRTWEEKQNEPQT